MWRTVGDEAELAAALDDLGWMLFFTDRNPDALRAFDESLERRRASGDQAGQTRSLTGVCQVLVAQGEVERTEQLSNELLTLARRHGDPRSEHFALHFLADCSLIRGTTTARKIAIERASHQFSSSATCWKQASRFKVWRCRRQAVEMRFAR